jgi:TolB-like protein/Tfp pilus assembly protein PilF
VNDTPAEREAESTWTRLRRRKVVQWGVVYVAAAWGFLQGLEYLSDTYDWPRQIQQLTTLALVIGLPIVLVLAWYHGDRGQQRITTPEFAILTLLLLLGGGAFWYYQRTSETATVSSPSAPSSPAFATDASIAVLPFVNMSPEKDQEYFADGISEELLNLLAQVPELRVIARTSSFSFKGKDVEIAEIARRLNVANVLEGSVRKSGDKIRITAQLVRASDSSHLWSQTYDRQMTDVFAVQDEIAAAVVEQLKIKLLGAAPTAKTTDAKAYALFLQARIIARQYNSRALDQAISLYKQALALDPTYPAAWVGLADTYAGEVYGNLRPADSGFQLARSAIERALALDPEYAPAQALLGWIGAFYDRDLPEAARRLEYALTLEPANPYVIGLAAEVARRLMRLDKAIAISEYGVTRDPVNVDSHFNLGLAYRYAGQLDKALAEFRVALGLSPNYIYGHTAIGEVLLTKGDVKAALTEMQQESDELSRLYGMALAYFASGQRAASDGQLAELIKKYGDTGPSYVATIFAYRGEADRAFAWLDKAAQHHDPSFGAIINDRLVDGIRQDPRWLPFLRKLGMAPEQLAAIKFDVTLPN